MAFYSAAKNVLSDYDRILIVHTQTEGHDDDWNPLPTNMIIYSDAVVAVAPEASDSVMILEKIGQNDLGYECVEKLFIIKDGGKSTLEVNIADYTDKEISGIEANGNLLSLIRADSFIGCYIYDFSGDSLRLVEEYTDDDGESFYFPNNGYSIWESYDDVLSEATLEEALDNLHLVLQK